MADDSDTQYIELNLDQVEREKTYSPFEFVLGGRKMRLKDPAELDWKDLVSIGEDPVLILDYAMSEEDHAFFVAQEVPGWKLQMLTERYQKHYGLLKPGPRGASRT